MKLFKGQTNVTTLKYLPEASKKLYLKTIRPRGRHQGASTTALISSMEKGLRSSSSQALGIEGKLVKLRLQKLVELGVAQMFLK